MPILAMKKVLLAKIESVYGTDPTPTGAANAILAKNVSITPFDAEMQDRGEYALPYFGNLGSIAGTPKVGMEFEVDVAGAGGAGTVPGYGPLFRACGLSETVNVGVDVTYGLVSTGFESVTLYYYIDGKLHKLTGCRGDLSFGFSNEGLPVYKFKIIGTYNAPTDTALATPTLTAFQKPLPFNKVNDTLTIHGYAAIVSSIDFNLGNAVTHKQFVNTTESVRITGRKVAGSISMEDTLLATKNWFTTASGNTTGALSLVHGTTAGNIVEISAPAVQIGAPKYDNGDGVQMISADLIFQHSTGNDQLTIKVR